MSDDVNPALLVPSETWREYGEEATARLIADAERLAEDDDLVSVSDAVEAIAQTALERVRQDDVMRERIVNESFGYDPIAAAVNATRLMATADGGSLHLDVRIKDVAAFIAQHTEASEADAETAIEHAATDGFLTAYENSVAIPQEDR